MFPIRLDGVCFTPGGRPVLIDIDLEIGADGITVVLGPNGAGKSVLLRTLAGLQSPDGGRIRWNGDVAPGPGTAMVFQQPILLRASVFANAALGLKPLRLARSELRRRTQGVLDRVGLADRAADSARLLSGGERQRLALARAWAMAPRLLLLDEPTAGVDPKARRDFWQEIHQLAGQGLTFLIATHYMDEAERCHRLAFISKGRLLANGTEQEIVAGAHLTTWAVSGSDLPKLADQLHGRPGVQQAVAFGNRLHVSGDNAAALEQTIAPFRTGEYEWRQVESGLEDVFIHQMGTDAEDSAS